MKAGSSFSSESSFELFELVFGDAGVVGTVAGSEDSDPARR